MHLENSIPGSYSVVNVPTLSNLQFRFQQFRKCIHKCIQLIWTIFIKRYTVSFAKLGVFFPVSRLIYILLLEKISRNMYWKISVTGVPFLLQALTAFKAEEIWNPVKKTFDRFRNLLIILSRLCYTFIHSMSLRKYDCFLDNSIIPKPACFMLFLCQLLLNFQGA